MRETATALALHLGAAKVGRDHVKHERPRRSDKSSS